MPLGPGGCRPKPSVFQVTVMADEHLPVPASHTPQSPEPQPPEPSPGEEATARAAPRYRPLKTPVPALGLPLLPVTFGEAVDEVDRMIAAGEPNYFITANLHYAMLSHRDRRLDAVNREAAFLVADGFPLLLAARLRRRQLPERVAGSDLIYALCERAAEKGHRVFFLGGAPGVADAAASELVRRYPGLQIAGVEVPPFRPLTADENARLVDRIASAGTDLLFVALGQPKGELWLWENRQALGVPAAVQLGASFDFVTGRIKRAPRWVQRLNLEWAYRLATEPRRLAPRYFQDAIFLARCACASLVSRCCRKQPPSLETDSGNAPASSLSDSQSDPPADTRANQTNPG